MTRQVSGPLGLVLCILAAAAMWVAGMITEPMSAIGGNYGICLPSPDLWPVARLASTLINLALFGLTALLLAQLDKVHSIVPGSDTVLVGMFLVMASANRWISGPLSSSVLFALANLAALFILFRCYRRHSAPQELFVIATIIALGSMVQYAFLFLIPVYIVGAAMMKCLDFRGIVAFLMGLAAPYWVVTGLGIVPLEAYRLPQITNLPNAWEGGTQMLAGLAATALTVAGGLLLGLNNLVKLYAGNTRRRLANNVLNLLGLLASVCILFDFTNMTAYLVTAYMIGALQLANLFALWHVHRGWLWLTAISALYIASFIFMTI